MLAAYRNRIVLATLIGMLAATLLAWYVLRRALRPVREIAARAAQISPASLSVRLDSNAAPVEMRQLTRAFNAMLDRLADGYQRLSQFSADLAHEIRTPVGALIGQTQVTLAKPREPDEYQQLLESNLEELNRLSHIAENILFLAHADHAALSVEREPVDLHAELIRIADYFEGPADERGMRFEVDAQGVASVNPMLCRRAINNLVVNAVRYGASDTVVRLRGTQDAQGATVVVENEGAADSRRATGPAVRSLLSRGRGAQRVHRIERLRARHRQGDHASAWRHRARGVSGAGRGAFRVALSGRLA